MLFSYPLSLPQELISFSGS